MPMSVIATSSSRQLYIRTTGTFNIRRSVPEITATIGGVAGSVAAVRYFVSITFVVASTVLPTGLFAQDEFGSLHLRKKLAALRVV